VNTGLLAIIISIAVVIMVLFAMMVVRRRRSQRLQEHFGPEYQRAVARAGDRHAAESDLAAREQRHRKLDIVELEPAAQRGYVVAWRATQTRFVDDPTAATREADTLPGCQGDARPWLSG
jgi:hypothetical protein